METGRYNRINTIFVTYIIADVYIYQFYEWKYNTDNGVRTNKNYYLCNVKGETLTPSGTEVSVVTTWQIIAKR